MTGEQQRSQARHQRILDAALDVFAHRGYRDAAVDDIAAASGTSKGGVYFHFPNKGSIFKALLQRTAGLLLERTEAAIAPVADPVARVDAALVTVLRLFAEHRTLARLFLIEALGAGPEFSAALMDLHARFAQLIARHLDEAVHAGAIAPLDTALAGTVWFGALNEAVVRWLLTGEPERLEDAYPALRVLLLRSIGAPVGGRSYGSATVAAPASPIAPDDVRRCLHEGLRRAHAHGAPVLVSISRQLATLDPLDLFAQAGALAHDRFYWERPADGLALAGAGTAHIIESPGPTEAGAAWCRLLDHAVVDDAVVSSGRDAAGPLLIGGFSFAAPPRGAFDPDAAPAGAVPLRDGSDNGRADTALWDGFPAGRLILPRLALVTTGGISILTLNTILSPEADAETEAARLLRWCESIFPLHPRPDRSGAGDMHVEDVQSRLRWERLVADGAQACAGGALEKVVLARAVRVRAGAPLDAATALGRLRDAYPGAYIFAVAHGARCFLGATPERLVRLRDGVVDVACLAGSAARGATPEEDAQLGNALLASAKDRGEHDIVVRGVRAALAGLCDDVRLPTAPGLLRLRNVQHLYTPVSARVSGQAGVLDLVARLHPTPAVGGYPREEALRFIREREGLDRGWYAGSVGWLDRHGEGEFAVALRCALLHGMEATLFAGCGIVAASDPAEEYAESCLKLRPVLHALGARRDE